MYAYMHLYARLHTQGISQEQVAARTLEQQEVRAHSHVALRSDTLVLIHIQRQSAHSTQAEQRRLPPVRPAAAASSSSSSSIGTRSSSLEHLTHNISISLYFWHKHDRFRANGVTLFLINRITMLLLHPIFRFDYCIRTEK
jgi:hypothetical protein